MGDNKIADAVRSSGRRHSELALQLGLSKVSFSDRMHGRTRWTLCDAIALAGILGVTLDDLVSFEQDLELGYALTEAAPA